MERRIVQMFGGDRSCSHSEIEIVRVIKSNGSIELRRECKLCQASGGGVRKEDVRDPGVYRLLRDDRLKVPPCVHCGVRGTEIHHWAPQALFMDADLWPTSYLCVSCHLEWHKKTSTT